MSNRVQINEPLDICPPRDIQKELMDIIHKLREENEGLKKKIEELQND